MKLDRYYQDIEVGDFVEVIDTGDLDFEMWCDTNGYRHRITKIEEESELVWFDGCPYAVAMADFVVYKGRI